MTDKHGVEVKIGDKVIGIDMNYTPPLHIGKIAELSVGGAPIISVGGAPIISVGGAPIILEENTYRFSPSFYSYEFELWTPERELIVKLEI